MIFDSSVSHSAVVSKYLRYKGVDFDKFELNNLHDKIFTIKIYKKKKAEPEEFVYHCYYRVKLWKYANIFKLEEVSLKNE
jgi:hypothetical protein